jgi:sugar lactone lactonase YvrE
LVVAPDGGAYATTFGPYDGKSPPGEVVGEVLYLAPGAAQWRVVADALNYANGVGVSPDGKTLYVSQTVSGSILKFTINPDGALSHRSNFALLDSLVPRRSPSPWLGPDSLKVDRGGDIYVAQFFGGKILKLSPQGKLLHVFAIGARPISLSMRVRNTSTSRWSKTQKTRAPSAASSGSTTFDSQSRSAGPASGSMTSPIATSRSTATPEADVFS